MSNNVIKFPIERLPVNNLKVTVDKTVCFDYKVNTLHDDNLEVVWNFNKNK